MRLHRTESDADFSVRDEAGRELLHQCMPAAGRPYIHPWQPTGFAESLTENEPPHHPWQHGLYVGLNDVNGWGFWTEGRHARPEADGRFVHHAKRVQAEAGDVIAWAVETRYLAGDGTPLLLETQSWRASRAGAVLDLCWTLAAEVDLRFGAYAYGGLFLRMPHRPAVWALAVSADREGPAADAQPARWCAVAMDLPATAARAGVAILDHPANPVHPVPWRVDSGFGIGPARCIAGAWTLAAGARATERYRCLAFAGTPDATAIDHHWQVWAATRDPES